MVGLEGTSVDHLVQPPCRSRVTYSRLHRTLSRWVLNTAREGNSTTSLGSLFQCSVTLRGKKFFLMFRRNFLCFNLCPLPLVLSLGTTEKSLCGKLLLLFHRITEQFGLEGTIKDHLVQPSYHWQGHCSPDQVAQSAIQPGLEHFQGGDIHI